MENVLEKIRQVQASVDCSIVEAKEALDEANNDVNKAIEIIKYKKQQAVKEASINTRTYADNQQFVERKPIRQEFDNDFLNYKNKTEEMIPILKRKANQNKGFMAGFIIYLLIGIVLIIVSTSYIIYLALPGILAIIAAFVFLIIGKKKQKMAKDISNLKASLNAPEDLIYTAYFYFKQNANMAKNYLADHGYNRY